MGWISTVNIEGLPYVGILRAKTGGHVLELVLVLDCGAGDSQFLARKVRECSVYSEIVPGHTAWSELTPSHKRKLCLQGTRDS